MSQRWKQEFIKIGKLDQFQSFINKEDGFTWNKDTQKWKLSPLSKLQFIKNMLGIDVKYGYHLDAGTAVHLAIQKHKFLENQGIEPIEVKVQDKIWRIFKGNQTINEQNINIPIDDCEEWLPSVTIHGITFYGKYDCKEPTIIHDIKTSKNMDRAKYIKSFQWKFYLLMSGLSYFQYHLLTTKYDESTSRDKENGLYLLKSNNLVVTKYDKIELERPADLEQQIENAVKNFSDFLEDNKKQIYDTACKHGITLKYFEDEIASLSNNLI